MINLSESMGPGPGQTRTPGCAVRFASVTRHVTDCATRRGSFLLRIKLENYQYCEASAADDSQEILIL